MRNQYNVLSEKYHFLKEESDKENIMSGLDALEQRQARIAELEKLAIAAENSIDNFSSKLFEIYFENKENAKDIFAEIDLELTAQDLLQTAYDIKNIADEFNED